VNVTEPVPVPVCSQNGKKPDLTGLLNTMWNLGHGWNFKKNILKLGSNSNLPVACVILHVFLRDTHILNPVLCQPNFKSA
jgi:hypothetical protein